MSNKGGEEPFLKGSSGKPQAAMAHQGYVINPPNSEPPPPNQAYPTVVPPPYTPNVQFNSMTNAGMRQPPPDHMTAAVMVTLCCFFPTGICAIMKASEARSAASYGDMQTAERLSKSAKRLINISIIAGILSTLVAIAIVVVYIVMLTNIPRHSY